MSDESIYSTLMKADEDLGSNTETIEARDLLIDYFALGEMEADKLKELLKSKNSYKAIAAASSISGGAGGLLSHIIDPATIGSTFGSVLGPVGSAVGYSVGWVAGKIPGVKLITDVVAGTAAGFLIGSAVYILQSMRSKWTSIKNVKKFMTLDLNAWELEYLKTKPLELQHGAELLTHYLRGKINGRISTARLLIISWRDTSSNFYLINAYVKMILMLLTYMENMPSSMVRSLLNVIEYDLNYGAASKNIDKDFVSKFQEFKNLIEIYLSKKIFDESVVEKLGKSLVTGLSATAPILPWMYSCFKGDDANVYSYNPDHFKKTIEEETLNTMWYRFWSDLSISKVNEIKSTRQQDFSTVKKKLEKMNGLIHAINSSHHLKNSNEEIPSEAKLSKTEKKLSKLMEYAEAFLIYTKDNSKNKKDSNIDRIRDLSDKLINRKAYQVTDDMWIHQKTTHYIYEWWRAEEEENYNKTIKATGSIQLFKNPWSKKPQATGINMTDEKMFKNTISIAFKIQEIFDQNKKLKNEFSIQTKKDHSLKTNNEKALQYAQKIDSFCELITYAMRLGNFMFQDKENDKISVYSLFGLWSIYNLIIDKYSTNIPKDILKFYKDKTLANDINSSEYLKKFFILPYPSFKKMLIPGFNKKYFEDNKEDFFRVFIYYFSNIVNLVSEIQYHIETLKQCKLIIAMFGEINTTMQSSQVPLYIIQEKLANIKNMITDYSKHINELQSIEASKKQSSWTNKIGLYNILFGKKTGFYENFNNKFNNIIGRIKLFSGIIEETIEYIEDKISMQNFKARSIDEDIAKNIEPFYAETLISFQQYILDMQELYPGKFKYIKSDELEKSILLLKERYVDFTSDKGLTSGRIPAFIPPSSTAGLSSDSQRMEQFILKIYQKNEFEFPNEIYQIASSSENPKALSKAVQNFIFEGECVKLVQKCIQEISSNEELQTISHNIFQEYPLFNDVRNPAHSNEAGLRSAHYLTLIFSLQKKTKITIINQDSENYSEVKNNNGTLHAANKEKILLENGSDDIIDKNNYEKLKYLSEFYLISLFIFNVGPATDEYINRYYEEKKSKHVLKKFRYGVKGLVGMCLAYLFPGIREHAEETIKKFNKIENEKKRVAYKRAAERNEFLLQQQKDLDNKRKEIELQKKELAVQKQMQRTQLNIYPIILHALMSQIERLGNSKKGEKLSVKINEVNREIQTKRQNSDDKENAIFLLKQTKPILSEHRGFFAFGKTQAYSDVLAIAKLYNINEADLQ